MIRLFGDGLAGRFLAHALTLAGLPYQHYGDSRHNTPPVGFVHLFQGRTFHRDPVEVAAYAHAVKHWRSEPLAREWTVRRSVTEGDRLHKSAGTETVPVEWRPSITAGLECTYSPGFTVAAGELLERLRQESAATLLPRRDHRDTKETKVLAIGLDIAQHLPHWRWDTNPGRTVDGYCPYVPSLQPHSLHLHQGLHLGGNPNGDGFTMGGRVNSKGEAKDDEVELASGILGQEVALRSEWWGERIANALDRWPLVGWLKDREFLFCGFGGRAMFWLPYCAQIAVEALKVGDNSPIPQRLRPDRF